MAAGAGAGITASNISAGANVVVAGAGAYVKIGGGSFLASLYQLPPVPAAFIGREKDLAVLESELNSSHVAGATISAKHAGIQGMGGVGKTAIATVLAHRIKERYPDAQIFLNLRGADPERRPPVQPVEAMSSIIRCFQSDAQLPNTLDELAPVYRSVLTDAGRILLLLDNASDAAQVRPLFPPQNCLLLVTSRTQFSLPGLTTSHLDCLPPREAEKLLISLSPRIHGHEVVAAQLCGNLPLALEVFASVVSDRKLTPVPELLQRMRDRQEKLAPVEAAFDISYEMLTEELRLRWRLLSVFPADFDLPAAAVVWKDVPADHGCSNDNGANSVDSAVADQGLNEARAAMEYLVNTSLVGWNKTTGRFWLHDLVRQFCMDKCDRDEQTAGRLRHARRCYFAAGRQIKDLYARGGQSMGQALALLDRERIDLEAALNFLSEEIAAQSRSVITSGAVGLAENRTAQLLAYLVDTIVHTGDLRFHPRQQIRWLEAQRDAARITKERKIEGDAIGHLGAAYAYSGEMSKAISHYEEALLIYREVGERPGECVALGNLGVAYARLGETDKAVASYVQQRNIAHELGDRHGEAVTLNNLGVALKDLGELDEAIQSYTEALKISREFGYRRGEGNALGNLGTAYAMLSEPLKAKAFYEEQLLVVRELGDRRGEGHALGNLGTIYADLDNFSKAIDFYQQALKLHVEIGDRHGEGIALWNLAHNFEALGKMSEATKHAALALNVLESIGDPNQEQVRVALERWRARV